MMREKHARRPLREFAGYHNAGQCHRALGAESPLPRSRASPDSSGEVTGTPVLGGLHHIYRRTA